MKKTLILFYILSWNSTFASNLASCSIFNSEQREFIQKILPEVRLVRSNIRHQKEKLYSLHQKWRQHDELDHQDIQWLNHLAEEYKENEVDWSHLDTWKLFDA